jgi:hypothetical protein
MVGSVSSFSLPSVVVSALGSARSLGLCGSRSVVASVSPFASVSCGCVGGLCGVARSSFPQASVFSASSFVRGRAGFAVRSVALVRSVASGLLPLWVSFPAFPCPVGLVPSSSSSRCFCGLGSGSWASLAFAVGLGVPALLFLPVGVAPPSGWGFVPVGGGWWSCFPQSLFSKSLN